MDEVQDYLASVDRDLQCQAGLDGGPVDVLSHPIVKSILNQCETGAIVGIRRESAATPAGSDVNLSAE